MHAPLLCYEFNDLDGDVFYVAALDEAAACFYAVTEAGEVLSRFTVSLLSDERLAEISIIDEDWGEVTLLESLRRHNDEWPGETAMLGYSDA